VNEPKTGDMSERTGACTWEEDMFHE